MMNYHPTKSAFKTAEESHYFYGYLFFSTSGAPSVDPSRIHLINLENPWLCQMIIHGCDLELFHVFHGFFQLLWKDHFFHPPPMPRRPTLAPAGGRGKLTVAATTFYVFFCSVCFQCIHCITVLKCT